MKVMVLAFLFGAVAIGQQPAALTTYHDPIGSISFQYSSAWTVVKKADSYSPVFLTNEPGMPNPIKTLQFFGQDHYSKTALEGLIFSYFRDTKLGRDACRTLAVDYQNADYKMASPQSIHGTSFTVGQTGGGSAGHGIEATVYTTYRHETCYAFETDFDTDEDVEGVRNLTQAEMRTLNHYLNTIMQSVRFDQP